MADQPQMNPEEQQNLNTQVPNVNPAPAEEPQRTEPKQPKKEVVIEETQVKTGSGARQIFMLFLTIVIVGLVAFYGLLFWGLLQGEVSNPLFSVLNIAPEDLKSTIQLMTNVVFGFFALIFLIATLVRFFQWIITPPTTYNRKSKLRRAGLNILFFFLMVGAWVGMLRLIAQVQVVEGTRQDQMIQTIPEDVLNLTVPENVEFNIGDRLYKTIPQKDIRQILWDFQGDGVVDGSGPIVTFRYLEKGENDTRYNVTAKVLYWDERSETEKEVIYTREVIIVNEKIRAVINATPELGDAPLYVNLSATDSVDSDGEIVYYEWDMDNDGEFEIRGEDEAIQEYIFQQIGEYIVNLRVTGTNNDTDTVSKKILAKKAEDNLRAEITADKPFTGLAPYELTLSGESSFFKSGEIVAYEWFVEGEENVVNNRKITRRFAKPGQYPIKLTVENEEGERHEAEVVVNVKKEIRDPAFYINTNPEKDGDKEFLQGRVPFTVELEGNVSEFLNVIEWAWDWENDGILDDFGQKIEHTFREGGHYDVRLRVEEVDGEIYEYIYPIRVNEVGTQAFIEARPASGEVPLVVQLDGSASKTDTGDIINYTWYLPGRDPISAGAQLEYQFDTIGVFPVILEVMTSTGHKAQTTRFIAVRGQSLEADFRATPSNGSAPLIVEFDPSPSRGAAISYEWDFGDGSPVSRLITPEHTYDIPGAYIAKLRIKDVNGVISDDQTEIFVEANPEN